MNAISSRQNVAPPSASTLRTNTGMWFRGMADCDRRLAEHTGECRHSFTRGDMLAHARKHEAASEALLRGDAIPEIRRQLQALNGGRPVGGQLGGILDLIEAKEGADLGTICSRMPARITTSPIAQR
nr:hypothetical protein [uncultured Roseococcus sp.]